MENLNAEQVKKELEGLAKFRTCPEYIKNALALINSQEQRIKELTEDVERVSKQCGEIIVECDERDAERLKQVAELTEENERLRGERAKFFEYKHGTLVRNALVLTKNKKEFAEFCEAIKADIVRAFAERLKEYYSAPTYQPTKEHPIKHTQIEHLLCMIDQIAKEMENERNTF